MADALTPEEWADPVAGNEGNKLGCGHSHPKGVAYLRKRFREAMAQAHAEGRAERDAEWRAACGLLRVANKDVTEGGDDCLWPWGAEPTSSPNDQCIRGCRCAALRALLAAGVAGQPSGDAKGE
jgi:hypothetical protein